MKTSSDPKGWIRGNTAIGPVLEVTTCCLQGKYGVEIRIESMNKDHSRSWVRISHGLNWLVTNLNNKEDDDNEQETSEMQFEDCALKSNARAFASRSKAKAKPQRRTLAWSSAKTIFISERFWTDIEPEKLFVYRLFVMVIYFEKKMERLKSGDKGLSSERFWPIWTSVWWNVEEYNDKRRRKQEKISISYWSIRTRNSLSSSPSKPFKTHSHWVLHYRTMY